MLKDFNFIIQHSLFDILNSDFWPFDMPFGGLIVRSIVEGFTALINDKVVWR